MSSFLLKLPRVIAVILSVSLIVFPSFSESHSFLTDPAPYDTRYPTKTCKSEKNALGGVGTCDQACPNYPSRRATYTHRQPRHTWKRGEKYVIKWAKNNHHGGFVSISIVPLSKMLSKKETIKYVIYQGCFEQRRVRCQRNEPCGTDNEVFEHHLTIPTTIPDGTYAFNWIWFGGLEFMGKHGKFPDYHSCSFIQISGGSLDVSKGYQPFFEANDEGKRSVRGRCHSASDHPGDCPVQGCDGPKYPKKVTVPRIFQNGQFPSQLYFSDYSDDITNGTPSQTSAPTILPTFTSTPTSTPTTMPTFTSTPTPSETPQVTALVPQSTPSPFMLTDSPNPSPPNNGAKTSPSPFNNDPNASCIWNGDFCCVATCGACGGKRCAKYPGGANNCCKAKIKKSKRICGFHPPPCRQRTSMGRNVIKTR